MSLSVCVTAYAETTPYGEVSEAAVSSSETIAEKADALKCYSLSDPDALLSENTYSYDEMIAYLIESGFTPVEAYEYMGPRPVETRSSRIEYQVVALDTAVVKRLYKLTHKFRMHLEYRNGSSSPSRIVGLSNPQISTAKGAKCAFEGDVFYELYDGRSFYCDYSGKLYKDGQPKAVTGEIGVGENITVSISVTNGNGYITDVYESANYYSSSLDA